MKSNSQVDFEISDEDMKILKISRKLKAMVKVVSSRYMEEKCKMKKPYLLLCFEDSPLITGDEWHIID